MPSLQLTDAQLQQIADRLFILQPPTSMRLPEPQNSTGADSLAGSLDWIKGLPFFPHIGVGVVCFRGGNFFSPRIWIHDPGAVWRLASTAKLAVLLAAVQLREDVRAIQKLRLLTTPVQYDQLFAMKELWMKAADTHARQIAGPNHAPRISTIFKIPTDDTEPNFFGPDPDAPDVANIDRKLPPPSTPDGMADLTWPLASKVEFAERLWLAGARSDNIAATSCISEIGVAYIKAVQRAYGLFVDDATSNMRMLLAGGYADVDTTARVSSRSTLTHRPLQDPEMQHVGDAMKGSKGKYDDQRSWQGGSAAALLAYLIALKQGSLGTFGHGLFSGDAACKTIHANLSDGGPGNIASLFAQGIAGVTTVTRQISKVGILNQRDGEQHAFAADFAYLETRESGTGQVMKYGIVATNICTGTVAFHVRDLANQVGATIHGALLTA